jgi:hypothetical protein
MNDMALKNNDRLNIRLPSDLISTLNEIQEKHGLGASEITRRCLEAVAEFYRQHGFFSFPVKMEPEAGWLMRAVEYQAAQNKTGAEAAAAKLPLKKRAS